MMKQRARHVAAVALAGLAGVLVFPHFSGLAEAQGRNEVKAATGPFTYEPAVAGSTTYIGDAGEPVTVGIEVCAPGGGTIFPAGDGSAAADIRVFGIEQVGDEDGNPLAEPVEVPLDSLLGMSIEAAFSLDPDSYTFYAGSLGDCVDVEVAINNPMVDDAYYGDYVVVMKAKDGGSGIGVGSGSRYHLSLRRASDTDTIPPTVSINSPSHGNSYLLGVIGVEVAATDPVPGTGVESMSATVSSASDIVSDEPLSLDDNTPQPAGSLATATGTFTPTGGTGPAGTTLASAFTSTSRSGIGTYTLNAVAEDGAGNVGTASSTFYVKYDVAFTQADGQINRGKPENSTGRFAFTVKRSALTSDGAFMFDQTVVVELVRTSDNAVVATHAYGTGDIKTYVQIDTATDPANPQYKTHFKRGDIGASVSNMYKARVLFLDVDGNLFQQTESVPVTF